MVKCLGLTDFGTCTCEGVTSLQVEMLEVNNFLYPKSNIL